MRRFVHSLSPPIKGKATSGFHFEDLEPCLFDTAAPKEMSHSLVTVEVETISARGKSGFASAQIEAELAAKLKRQSNDKMEIFLRASGGTSAIQALRGSILERARPHKALQTGRQFLCRDLDTQAEFWKDLPTCAASEDIQDHTAIASLQPGVYMQGIYEYDLGGIDAVVKPGRLYQITISERHKIDRPAAAIVAAKMGDFDNLELYWAVAQQTFTPDFWKQPFVETKEVTADVEQKATGIKQFLLLLSNGISLWQHNRIRTSKTLTWSEEQFNI